MKKTTLFMLLNLSLACVSHAGFSVGLPHAVRNQVDKLDDKVIASVKANNIPAANTTQPGNGTAEVSWAPVSAASSYTLYWGTAPNISSMAKVPQATSPYLLTGLTNGTIYYYAVASVTNGIESNLTPIAQITPSATLPLIPQNVAVSGYGPIGTLVGGQTTVSWNPVAGATSYNIYWSAKPGVTTASNQLSATSPYTHAGLTYGQTYYYRVSALNGAGESVLSPETASVAKVYTTVQRLITPTPGYNPLIPTAPYDIPAFAANGYGLWTYQAGSPYTRMGLLSTPAPSTNTASLLNFFTITDIHITDKESPAEALFFGLTRSGIISAYSPAMLYTTHVLDAVARTVNAMHKDDPIDFGLSLGDAANSGQYNELRWFIDVLDGKAIVPSSGGHAGADRWDYQKPYKAVGLDTSIPWYSTLGNHDHFWVGSFPMTDKTRKAAIGNTMLNIGNIFTNALGTASSGYYMGAIDGNTQYGTPTGAGPVTSFTTPPTVIADENRREMTRNEWIGEFFNTSTYPKGHGFSRNNETSGFANYTFMPNPNVPIKVIVLDNTQSETDPSDGSVGPDWGHGSLDNERYTWLVNELEKGQAEDKLMIIAAHVPIGVRPAGALDGWSTIAQIKEADLIAKLKTYPNLILFVAGHRHVDDITRMPSPDPAHPELGFWEVETRSLREFPQEFRTFKIYRNSDNNISIYVTDVDPITDGSLAETGRTYAIAANELFNNIHTGANNAELVKELTPRMQAKIQQYGTLLP